MTITAAEARTNYLTYHATKVDKILENVGFSIASYSTAGSEGMNLRSNSYYESADEETKKAVIRRLKQNGFTIENQIVKWGESCTQSWFILRTIQRRFSWNL